MGYCSSCEDATHLTNRIGTCAPSTVRLNTSQPNCNYTLGASTFHISQNDNLFGRALSAGSTQYGTSFFFDLATVNASVSEKCDRSERNCTSGAVVCNHIVCIGTYNASLKGGNFTETLLATENITYTYDTILPYSVVNVECAGSIAAQALVNLGYNITNGMTGI